MTPQNDTQPQLRLQRPVGRFAYIPTIICSAAFTFVALVLLWVGQASNRVYSQGADALTIRAVMRANVTRADAEKLARRIGDRIPAMDVNLVDEAMGRSLLALQEPWIAQMPDFEVTPLPILLEMRHPDLLRRPLEVSRFVEDLKHEPEVDFVAYNETAHDRLVKLAGSTADIESHTLRWVLSMLGLAAFTAQFAFSRLRNSRSVLGAGIFAGVTWLGGLLLGTGVFRLWESGALDTGDWHRIPFSSYGAVGGVALMIVALGSLLSYGTSRLRP